MRARRRRSGYRGFVGLSAARQRASTSRSVIASSRRSGGGRKSPIAKLRPCEASSNRFDSSGHSSGTTRSPGGVHCRAHDPKDKARPGGAQRRTRAICRRRRRLLNWPAMRRFSKREVAEFYRRLEAGRPIPQTELEFINPFTLLVAVVLSAQATDIGVNKATPALFDLADTPQKMLALGEARITELIRTIRLFRTQARNIVALSRMLTEQHGGILPPDREALEKRPWGGPKTV